jgi:hypothetical protein
MALGQRERGRGVQGGPREGCGPDGCKGGGAVLGHHGSTMFEREKERKREG